MLLLKEESAENRLLALAERVKRRRLEQNLSQAGLAARADMSVHTYRHFEKTGEISVASLLGLAIALDAVDDFDNLFATRRYNTIDEVIADNETRRRRGYRNE